MTTAYLVLASLLLLTLIAGLFRILAGPTPADRMLAGQLFGSAGVAVLLLLGRAFHADAFYDVALVFALLAAVAVVAFVRKAWSLPASDQSEPGREQRR